MLIRQARVEDALAMAHVIVDAFMQANQGIMPEEALEKRRKEWTYEVSARAWEETLREINDGKAPQCCSYVAENVAGEVVGLAYGSPSAAGEGIGEVGMLYVRADHQGQGIGRALVQTVAAYLAQEGMPTLYIAALAASERARHFYESLGGQLVGTREDFENGVLIPLVVYGWADTQALIRARR
jgi:ribosomal protein S18 acetylase RimI-like enzyme